MMQAPYPIFFKAPIVPGWQDIGMSDSAPFDPVLVRAKMKEQGVTQADLAKLLRIPQSAVSNFLNEKHPKPRKVSVQEAATIHAFLGMKEEPSVVRVPVIGFASAGMWQEAITAPIGEMLLSPKIAGPRTFGVEIKGDSMDRLLPEGGFAAVDPDQRQLYDRKVYLVRNGDHETTIKLYRSDPARLEPVSRNDTHQPILLGGDQHVEIIGRVVFRGSTM